MAEAFGLHVADLSDGWTPLRIVTVIEALDEHGDLFLAFRTSDDLPMWTAIGMAEAIRAYMVNQLYDELDDG